MTNEASFRYQRRQCKATFEGCATSALRGHSALIESICGVQDTTRVPSLLTTHPCKGGHFGVADLIGCHITP